MLTIVTDPTLETHPRVEDVVKCIQRSDIGCYTVLGADREKHPVWSNTRDVGCTPSSSNQRPKTDRSLLVGLWNRVAKGICFSCIACFCFARVIES